MTSGLDRKVKLFDIKHSQNLLDLQGDSVANYNNVKSSQISLKIQSMFIPDLPVYSAKFIQDGNEAILTGNRKHFYVYHIERNKLERSTVGNLDQKNLSGLHVAPKDYICISSSESGEAHMLCQRTKKHLFSLKMNGSCSSVAFTSDSRYMFTVGDQADIYQWDLRMQKCLQKTADVGNDSCTVVDVSQDG